MKFLNSFHIVYFRILSFGGSTVLLFAPVEIMMSCVEIHISLLSIDCGAVISSKGSTVLFATKASKEPKLLTKPSAVIRLLKT
jgi:hypothetical protein